MWIRRSNPNYSFPPGLEHNLLWYAFRKFKPQDPIALFEELARRFGPIAHYQIGPEHIVFVNHPEWIREILVVQNDNFVKERTVQRTKMLLGEGMITSEGRQHRAQRQVAQPAFHRQRIGAYADAIVEEAVNLRDSWQAGETLDIAQEMMRLTLRIVARTLFGTELALPQAKALADAINKIMDLYHYLVILPAVETLVHLNAPKVGAFGPARARLDGVVYNMIEDRRRRGSGDSGDLLDMMLAAAGEGPEAEKQLRDQIITIFLAGYETVANALTWTWYLLSENPAARHTLQQEVDAVLAGRTPTLEDVPQLKYCEMALAESLRLYPPAWAMGRRALNDFRLGPYFLPKGTTLLISQFITHREEQYFPDPLRFDPLRFTAEEKAKRPKFVYFPFGAGPRQCIGEAFAWMESVLVMATLAQKWQLQMVPGHRVQPQPLITLRPKYGMKMTVAQVPLGFGNEATSFRKPLSFSRG